MKYLIAILAVTVILAGGAPASAGEITRSGTVYGPYGVSTYYTNRYCYDGTCGFTRRATGPYGYSVSRSGTTTEIDDGVYQRNVTATGPRGNSISRSGTIVVDR